MSRLYLNIIPAICVTLLLVSPVTAEYTRAVKVAAGGTDRIETPVSVELPIDMSLRDVLAEDGSGWALVTRELGTWPAQVEPIDKKKVRVWWILKDLKAGEKLVYNIHIGDVLAGEAKKYGSFAWKDSSEPPVRSTDLRLGDHSVLRYMWTPFNKEDIELTKKPFHHVFDPDGSRLITKGSGGLYPHHRGIYFGYNRCRVGDQSYDTWHAHKGEHQLHVKILETITGPVIGGHTVSIHWNDRQGKAFAEEKRHLRVYRQSKNRCLIEFQSLVQATDGPVRLDGDRQHAGVQFRAAQHVAENQKSTRYLRPQKWAHLKTDQQINSKEHRDLPWNALQFPIGDRSYTIAYLSDPANPEGADFSERLYGRFGEFFPWDLAADKPLSVRYRWWIDATGKVTRDQLVKRYEDLAHPPKISLVK